MSNVTLTIGGRTFTVATAKGEEAHIAGLGRMIDAKLSAMGEQAALSESRMLLFAALLLADELHEAQTSGGGGEATLDDEAGRRLEQVATTLENLAQRLES
ncbi:MAG: cell division protein ZapA [Novosphingobium sp.]|nr:cell division protein ZapA [Novosphingobium sp.]